MSKDVKNYGRGSAVSFAPPAYKDRIPLADVIRHEAGGTSPKALPHASNVPNPMSKGKERIASLLSSTDAVSMMVKKNEDRHGKRHSARFFGKKEEEEREGDSVLVVEDGGARKRRVNISIDDSVETDSISTWGTSDNSREDTEVSSDGDDVVPEPLNVLYYTFFQLCKVYKLHKGCTHLRDFFGHWTDQVGLDQMDIYPDMKVLNLSEAYIGVKHLMILGDMLRVEKMDRFHASALASAYVKLPSTLPDTFSFSRLPELECIDLSRMCLDYNIDERQRLRLRPEDWALLPSSMVFSPKEKKASTDGEEEEEAPFFPYTNKISGNAGVRYFLAAITGHPSLKKMDLSHNAIGAALLPALCRCIKGTPSMVRVGLEDTGLRPDEVACVQAMCELNQRRIATHSTSLQKDHRKAWRAIQVQWLRKWCASVWEGHQQTYGQTGGPSVNRLSDVVFSASSLLSTSAAAADTTNVHAAVKADLPTSIPPLFVSETPCITTVEPPANVVQSIERFLQQLGKDTEGHLKVVEGRIRKGSGTKTNKRRASHTPNGRRRSVSVISSDASLSKDEEEPYLELPSRPTTRAWRQNSTSSVTFMSTPDPVLKSALSSTIPTTASSRGPPTTFLRHEMKYSHVFNTPFLRYLKQVEVRGGGKSSSPHQGTSAVGNTAFPFSPSVTSSFPSRTRSGSARGLPPTSSASAISTLGPSSSTASSSSFTVSGAASSMPACVLAREVEDLMKSAFVDPRVAELTFLQGRLPCATLPTCKAFAGLKGIGTARWIDGTISSMPLDVAEGLKKEVAASLLMKAIRRTLFPPPPKPKSLQDRDGLPQRGWRAAEEERYFMLLDAQEKQWNLLLSKIVSLMQRVRVQVGDALYYENEEPYWLWFLPVEEEEERDPIVEPREEEEEKMAHSNTGAEEAVRESDDARQRRKIDMMVELHSSVIPYPSRRGSKKKRRSTDPVSKKDEKIKKGEDDTETDEDDDEEEEEEEAYTAADTIKRHPDAGVVSHAKGRIGASTKDDTKSAPPPPPCTLQIARGQFFGDQELFGTTALYLFQRQKRLYEAAQERRRQYGGQRHSSSRRPHDGEHGSALPSSSTSTTTTYEKGRGKGKKEQEGIPMSALPGKNEKKTHERQGKPLEPPVDLGILREQHKFREGDAVLRRACTTGGTGSDATQSPYWQALSSEGTAGSASHSLPPFSRPLSSSLSPLFSPKVKSPPISSASSTSSAFSSTIPPAKAGIPTAVLPPILPGDGALPSLLPAPTTTAAATRPSPLPASTTIRTEGVVSTQSSNETTENGARAPPDSTAPYVTLWQLPLEVAFFYLFDPYQQLHLKAAAVVQSFPELQDIPPIVASQVGYVLQCFGVTVTEMDVRYGPSRTLAWHEDLMHQTILLDEGEFILSTVSSVTGKKTEKRFYGSDVHRVVLTNEEMYALDAPYRLTIPTDGGDAATIASRRLGNAQRAEVLGKAAALQQYREQKEFLNQQKKKKKKQQQKKAALSPPLPECTAAPFSSSACEVSSLPVKSSSPDSPPSSGGPRLSFEEDTVEEEVEYRLTFGSQASHWRYYTIQNEDWMLLPVDVRVAFSAGSVVLGNKRGNESL